MLDTANQQMQRVAPAGFKTSFRVKLRNGTVAHSSSLEDLLTFENIASKQIVRLDAVLEDGDEDGYLIVLRFVNLNEEDDTLSSVNYVVVGQERDWVLVTSSELEERIGRTKCFAPQGKLNKAGRFRTPYAAYVFLLLSMGGMVYSISQRPHMADVIETKWKTGALRDPIEALILVERGREVDASLAPVTIFKWAVGYPLALGSLMALGFLLLSYLYPSYVFCWGDYAKVYERRVSTRKTVFVSIILALIIGVISGMIVNKVHWGGGG